MGKPDMTTLQQGSLLDGDNSIWLESLYEAWLQDPESVSESWRDYFDALPQVNGQAVDTVLHSQLRAEFARITGRRRSQPVPGRGRDEAASLEHERKQVRVLQLINAYRFRGHQFARTDPLSRRDPEPVRELDLATYELTERDFDTVFRTGSLVGPETATLENILIALNRTYCGTVGAEYMHITETAEKRWLQQRLESVQSHPHIEPQRRRWLLQRLSAAEGIERYLHARYVGQKRFSLEGGESLIPLMGDLIEGSGACGIKEIVIGMSHRGRLNVLVNILGKLPSMLFSEFEDQQEHKLTSGDVKYHQGFSSNIDTPGGQVHLALAFNPSHLEIVAPVVQGSVRARQQRYRDNEGDLILPVVIHGDAAFAGQGVVMETLNMSGLRGFTTRGSVHIVINNQIGFTTSQARDQRSTLYCTDVAKMVNAPIFHVNGDDPEAVLFVTRVALDYRMTFKKDVVIDLVCYRRHGHNEADEPAATQPMMYQEIRELPTTRMLYAERLVRSGVIDAPQADNMILEYRALLDAGQSVTPAVVLGKPMDGSVAVKWKSYLGHSWDESCDTTIERATLVELAECLQQVPVGFALHPRVAKIMDDRRKMAAGALPVDWGFAEALAFASLLRQGFPIRLTGQDSERGTFFHRHAVLHNQQNHDIWVPLKNIADDQPPFLVFDSMLSEEAVLAFEYGYATTEPESLTVWEAQYGDFANVAQVVIDQFIASGEAKWGRLCGLTLLLPHGYEGQGPEHSSARLERFLQLCVDHNIQVCNPTTPAQMFHMLRRQMIRPLRRPLVVMSPKSLLRHKLATSSLEELAQGRFRPVLGDVDAQDTSAITRLVLCSGRVYYDLLERRRSAGLDHVALVRIEQLYPFPWRLLREELARYDNLQEFVWCQEEPQNQGAWYAMRHKFEELIGEQNKLIYTGREPLSAPAVGYASLHVQQQERLVKQALGLQ